MKKTKVYLSLMLVAAIVLSSLTLGLGQMKAASLVTKTPVSNPITFYVPETIYLTPAAGKTSSFQYYVDSSTSGALDNSKAKDTGVVYFNCANATNVSITCLGASVTLGSNSSSGSTLSTTVTAGTLLSGIFQGGLVTLPWTATYTIQGQQMTATAYTVCYAPNVEPVGAGSRVHNNSGIAGEADLHGFAYISGVQGYESAGNRTFNQTTGNKVAPLLGVVTDTYGANIDYYDWTSTSPGGVYFGEWAGNNDVYTYVQNSPKGTLTVDVSRYDDINQIPNLTSGFVVTNTYSLAEAWYYMSDYDDGTEFLNDGGYAGPGNQSAEFNSTGNLYLGDTSTSQSTVSGIIYGGQTGANVYSNELSGSGIYNMRLKAAYNAGRGARWDGVVCYVNVAVTKVDKTELRATVTSHTNYGLQAADYTPVTWINYANAFSEAAVRLGNPMAQDVSTSALMSAYNALIKQQYTATITHAGTDGKFSEKETVLVFNAGDTVTAEKRDSYSGYSCSIDTKTWYSARANIAYTFDYTPNTYTVTFDPQGGLVSPVTSTVTYNTIYGAGTGGFPTPSRTGYIFDGWYTGIGGTGSQVLLTATFTKTDNTTLYAKWSGITYTILYNANATGTTGSTPASIHTYDVTEPLTKNGFARPGFVFQGWATTPSPDDLIFIDQDNVLNLTATNGITITLYAIWNSNAYTVLYNGNGATGGVTVNSNHYYGQSKNLTLNGFVKTGYSFAGWSASVGGPVVFSDGESVLNLTQFGTFNLYAVWAATSKLIAQAGSTTVIDYGNNWIYGLETGITQEEFKNDYVTLVGDAELVITLTGGVFGTGTKVEVVDNETENVIETYTIVIFGDVNGDGNVDGMDAGRLVDIENHIIVWDSVADAAFIKAGDLNGDENWDSVDAGIIADVGNNKSILDQTTGLIKI